MLDKLMAMWGKAITATDKGRHTSAAVTNFQESLPRLFDIAICKCPFSPRAFNKVMVCSCPVPDRILMREAPFLHEQRTKHQGRIVLNSVDKTATKEYVKRLERQAPATATTSVVTSSSPSSSQSSPAPSTSECQLASLVPRPQPSYCDMLVGDGNLGTSIPICINLFSA